MNQITFRMEDIGDYRQVEELTREAFRNFDEDGNELCTEHFMVHNLRKTHAYLPELSLIACDGGKIVGHIIYTVSYVVSANHLGHLYEVISFGPISVLPAYQKRGIGSALIERTKEMARERGYKGIFIYGDPGYYNRFGFVNAGRFHVTTPEGKNFDYFMGLALSENSLEGIEGKLYEFPGFRVEKDALDAYRSTFPSE